MGSSLRRILKALSVYHKSRAFARAQSLFFGKKHEMSKVIFLQMIAFQARK